MSTLIVSVSLSLFVGKVLAESNKWIIAAHHIDDVLEKSKPELPYNQVINKLEQHPEISLDIRYFHALRSVKVFNDSLADCLFPAAILPSEADKPLIESIGIVEAKAHFIGLQKFSTQDLVRSTTSSKIIGFKRGNTFGGTIDTLSHHQLIPLNTGADIVLLLQQNRIDIFLGYFPDAQLLVGEDYSQSGFKVSDFPFYKQKDAFKCFDTPSNRKLVEFLNEAIAELHNSNFVNELFKK
ncbi:transporter substrate-binding domain-containing protein [Alteromonas sp. ASW11-36]|uniref:Transporter substrate-binding domain-containing protein n=1 Tax=Alteromonas arenosi TaxID=3055817 RepID=A0ABT7SYR6_9ALTE|nr:transporter substrate-binding domain-containing protein [Alteromonas sp. ASW11-36]MDM7861316.1 transporter substrate-binding domain-containing protein [Alteromonas sp. ASW11-36]